MFHLLHISSPPLTGGALQLAAGIGAVVLCLVLLLFGRVVWRIFAALWVTTAAVLLAAHYTVSWQVHPAIPLVGFGVAGAVLGIVLARLWWAVTLGAVLAVAALLAVLWRCDVASAVPAMPVVETLGEWLFQVGRQEWRVLTWLWNDNRMLVLASGSAAAAAGLGLGLFCPVFTRIFTTCLLGAVVGVLGSALVLVTLKPGFSLSAGHRIWILAGLGVILGGIGFIYQFRSEKHARAAKAAKEPPAKKKGKKEGKEK